MQPQPPPPVKPPVPPRADLELRIAVAFRDPLPGDEAADLLAEARSAAEFWARDAAATLAAAMDPALAPKEAERVRRVSDSSIFRRDRAEAAVSRLGRRLAEMREIEQEQRKRDAYEAAERERDALAAELAGLNYAEFAARLASVLKRIAANDRLLKVVGQNAPSGRGRLASAEAVARGLGDTVWVQNGQAILRLTEGCRLPPWGTSGRNLYDS
jgi:hypothetical protein